LAEDGQAGNTRPLFKQLLPDALLSHGLKNARKAGLAPAYAGWQPTHGGAQLFQEVIKWLSG
jgi:hypothetical protein